MEDDFGEKMYCDFGKNTKAYKEGLKFIISPEDWDFVKKYSFQAMWSDHTKSYYVVFSSKKDGLNGQLLHRILMNAPEDLVVDHKNRKTLDNRRKNLRVCTHQQNNINKSMYSNNKSGVVGVCFHKRDNKWTAQIKVDKKQKHLGNFENLEDAITARKEAEEKYYGEFACDR